MMTLERTRAAIAAKDPPTLEFVCSEVIGACDAVYAAFPDGPALRAQIEDMSLAMEDFRVAAQTTIDAETRAAITRVWKVSMAPCVKLLGAPRRHAEDPQRARAVRWLFDAWSLFDRVEGITGAPIGVLSPTKFHR